MLLKPNALLVTVRRGFALAFTPRQKDTDTVRICEARVVDERIVTDSGGHKESRPVIATTMVLDGTAHAIEMTLTDRDSMLFRMLVGRTAIKRGVVVSAGHSFILGGSREQPPESSLKIAVLSRNPRLYSTSRLIEEANAANHETRVIDTLKCYMDITSSNPSVWYRGEKLERQDAVIPRIGASVTNYGTAVIRQFEMMDTYSLVGSIPLGRSRSKLRALQLLSRKGLGLPVTGFAHDVHNTRELIKLVGGAPLVVKLLEGTQGRGVVLAETIKAAESVIDAFTELKADFLVQEYIKEAGGSDVRCFVIGRKVVAAMERTSAPGEFRSNLHRGGTARQTKLTPAERRTAVKAAQTMGLNVAGVDLLRSERGPLVMEVNSSPGLKGIEESTGINVAKKIIQFVEEFAQPGKAHGRSKG